ncbi:MAG: hypothetical protein HYW23_03125 [Candidatus Aenigmarchaeota archaeon]|nr:hypothetical protein [Candidatus Aenigmarchaeota archaeon]
MEITIIEEKDNSLFKRKDLKIGIKHIGAQTPSKKELASELAKKYGVDETQVIIDYIFSQKGLGESFAVCKILNEKPKEVKPAEAKSEKVETQTSAAA